MNRFISFEFVFVTETKDGANIFANSVQFSLVCGYLVMDSFIPGQESCQRMTGPLTNFVHKIVKS